MSAYWIAHVTVHDSEQYKKYTELAKEVFPKYQAEFLVRDEAARNLEGPEYKRHVLIRFPTMELAEQCYHSREYQMARKQREGCCDVQIILTHALEN